jgi:mRNA degradation ribonuclease J1/J2
MPDGSTTPVAVAATVGHYRLGAHASADELVTMAAALRADEVMPVHGHSENQRIFAERLGRRGQATTPAEGIWRPKDA